LFLILLSYPIKDQSFIPLTASMLFVISRALRFRPL
jgi:hypothetical protein